MVKIAFKRDKHLSEQAQTLIKDYYCLPDESSPQEAFARAAQCYSNGDDEFAQRIYDYASKGWFMFSSPVLSNAPKQGEKPRALPISCFLTYVDDTLEGLIDHTTELRWLSVKGGGVGGHWSSIRSNSDKAPGPIPFIHTVDADMTAYKQGRTRKGSYAAYLDISHPDIVEFIQMRIPQGDINRKNLNLHHGVNITDLFMHAVEANGTWDLIDPHTKEITETLSARKLWEQLLEARYRTGEPYIHFIDTAIRALPQEQKDLGLTLHGSNLCSEIELATNNERTAVCCLSSVNIEQYDKWSKTNMIQDLIRFLDNVLEYFIKYCPDTLSKAKYSAYRERSLGLGAMGYHSYLQSKNIAFESEEALNKNIEIFKHIKEEALKQTYILGKERGEAPDMVGSGKRNAHLLAIAPNANSSIIIGTSPSIEPLKANAYTHRTRVGSHLIKNKNLENHLEKLGMNTEKVWSSIITTNGSVQHLDFLDDHTKEVYKTASEINQNNVVLQAGVRQKYLCQSQSLNIFFAAGANRKYLHEVHFNAWKNGCKGLYYLRTEAGSRAENVSLKVKRDALQDYQSENLEKQDDCVNCQG